MVQESVGFFPAFFQLVSSSLLDQIVFWLQFLKPQTYASNSNFIGTFVA